MRNSKKFCKNSLIAAATILLVGNTVSLYPAALVLPIAQFFVSPTGNDAADGSFDQPFATLERARAAVRRVDRSQEGRIEVILREGVYFLDKTFELDPSDSGAKKSTVIYRTHSGEPVTISGGVRLRLDWKPFRSGIYQAKVPEASTRGLNIDQLFVNGERLHLARYPNYRRVESLSSNSTDQNSDETWFNPDFPVFGGTSENAISVERVQTWANPIGAFVHALHQARWGSKHYRVVDVNPDGRLRLQGGWQENRGGGFDPFFRGGYHKELLFVENVFEELDVSGEFYFDRNNETLYVIPKEGIDLNRVEIITPHLDQLLSLRGNRMNPIQFVRFEGIRFQHTERIFLEPYERLLRGDWSIARLGAAFLEGTENCVIADCEFSALGGNAVFISRYNRNVQITGNHFFDLCESAVCLVGDMGAVRSPAVEYRNTVPPDKVDLTPGPQNPNYPANCIVDNNLIHDLGLVGKQTAGVFISMAEGITVSHNTIYRTPRAAICVNDGTWGGHIIEYNDAFNTVRETGDHGPFNSWGRDRHWETPGGYGISSDHARTKARSRLDNHKTTIIRNNRFAHPGGHSWGIDLDDGSSSYEVRENLCLGMGVKLREGFLRTVENNIIIQGFGGFHVWYEGCEDVIRRNIFVSDQPYQFIRANPAFAKEFDYNLFWNDGKEPTITGVGEAMSLSDWRSKGLDQHSILADPLFLDPQNGDYTVREDSPALGLGFRNFPMNQFGTLKPAFQNHVRNQPRRFAPAATDTIHKRDSQEHVWLGAVIKNLVGAGEKSATGMASETGVLLQTVSSASAAHRIGFRENDVILGIRGQEVSTVDDLLKHWSAAVVGETVFVSVFRDQQRTELSFEK